MKRILLLILTVLLFATDLRAQTALAMPFVKAQWFDNTGRPCAGCLMYSYVTGTTTRQNTYTSTSGTTANVWPTVLDAQGRANIYLRIDLAYRLRLTTSSGNQIWQVDGQDVGWSQQRAYFPLGATVSLNGAASTSGVTVVGNIFSGGTGTTTKPMMLIEPTGTTAGTTWSTAGTPFGLNMPTGFAGNFVDAKVAGTSKFVVTSTGTVGMGTGSPGAKLELSYDSSVIDGLRFTDTFPSTGRSWKIGSGVGATGQFGIYDITAAATRMSISSAGLVGVGVPTPAARMDVASTMRVNQQGSSALRLTNGGLDIGWSGSGNADIQFGDFSNGWAIGENGDASFRIFVTSSGAIASTPLVLTQTGKLGIGVTDPGSTLTLSNNSDLLMRGLYSVASQGPTISFAQDGGNTPVVQRIKTGQPTAQDYTLDFDLYGGSSLSTVLSLHGSGYVGIGTASPAARLDLTAGSLQSTIPALNVTGTLSSTNTPQIGVSIAITSAGSGSAAVQTAVLAGIASGYTGATTTTGVYAYNSIATATGANYGATAFSVSGSSGTGTFIGIRGTGLNSNASGKQVGGYFDLSNGATPTFASAALMADNGSTTSNIFVARDNGTAVFTVADGGGSTFTGAVAIGNTVSSVSPTSPNRTVTIVVGGVTLYLAAKTSND